MKIEIINLIYELTYNDPKYVDTFKYQGTYDDIIIYWTYWYINNLPKDDDQYEDIPDKSPLKDNEKLELVPIFSGHYNSSDTHLILFYKYKSKEILVKLQNEKPQMCIIICEHQARELLSVVDRALILSNTKIIAQGTPSQLIKNENARNAYFGEFFKIS